MDMSQSVHTLFSVVIPLYNKADTITRAVRSVAAQTFNNWELIVVNDGSTDDSLSIVRRLAQAIPMRIIDKPNAGVSSARNAGAAAATGRYIALLDGDDIWLPNHLELLSEAIGTHPDVKFFGTGYERVSGGYVYYTIPWGGCCVKNVYSAFQYGQPINSSTVAVEKAAWDRLGGFSERYVFYEDYEFFFRLGLYTKCCVIRKISARYMDDALVQATETKRDVSRMTRPHLAFIDNSIRDSLASPEMLAYAVTHMKLAVFSAFATHDADAVASLIEAFPNIARVAGLSGYKFTHYGPLYKFRAAMFRWNYKIRCHLIVWRKHV